MRHTDIGVSGVSAATGEVVAITGAGRGIGRATAAAFLSAGARVAIGDLDGALAARTAAELSGLYGEGRVIGLELDVTDRSSFEAFLDRTATDLGTPNVLVNNAGIMPTGLLADESDTMTDRMIDVNLRAVITGCKLTIDRLTERGIVVNVASAAGLFGAPGLATYTGTKAAVLMFSESLRLELSGSGLHVMSVLPGVVNTELSAGANYSRVLRPFIAVTTEQVANAIVSGVHKRREIVNIPRALRIIVGASGLLPRGVRRRAEHLVGLDTAYTDADPVARATYHARLQGDVR